MREPGLITRVIQERTEDHVLVREEWAVQTPDCPLMVVEPWTWPLKRVEGVVHVTRRVWVSIDHAKGVKLHP